MRLGELGRLPPDRLAQDIVPMGEFGGLIPTMIGSALALIAGAAGKPGQIT